MSRIKYDWWGYAKSMIRRYPNEVNPDEKRAVEAAVQETQTMRTGAARMDVVRKVLFDGTHNIEGAAIACNVSYMTARHYHTDFIRAVGKHFSCRSLIYA